MRTSANTYTHLPISFFPTSIPRELFEKVKLAQIPLSKIMDRVSRDTEWLYSQLESVAEIDEFVRKMIEISRKAHSGNF